jgi:uncharacterized membrane-anchored protein
MTFEKFETMESLTSTNASKQLEQAIRSISRQLAGEGFDDNDIKEYVERIVEFVVDDLILPL